MLNVKNVKKLWIVTDQKNIFAISMNQDLYLTHLNREFLTYKKKKIII